MAEFTQSIIFAPGDDGSLCHFGILGMKWGVRRYQNPDGTLTDEGRARYGSPEAKQKYARDVQSGAIFADSRRHPQVKDAILRHPTLSKRDARKSFTYDRSDGRYYLNEDVYRDFLSVANELIPEDIPNRNYVLRDAVFNSLINTLAEIQYKQGVNPDWINWYPNW